MNYYMLDGSPAVINRTPTVSAHRFPARCAGREHGLLAGRRRHQRRSQTLEATVARRPLRMSPDLFLQASELAVDLFHQQVEGRSLLATGFACAQIAKAVAHEMQRDLYDVQRLPSLLQVAVELDLGR